MDCYGNTFQRDQICTTGPANNSTRWPQNSDDRPRKTLNDHTPHQLIDDHTAKNTPIRFASTTKIRPDSNGRLHHSVISSITLSVIFEMVSLDTVAP